METDDQFTVKVVAQYWLYILFMHNYIHKIILFIVTYFYHKIQAIRNSKISKIEKKETTLDKNSHLSLI